MRSQEAAVAHKGTRVLLGKSPGPLAFGLRENEWQSCRGEKRASKAEVTPPRSGIDIDLASPQEKQP